MSKVIGIDLGTTNSCVAISQASDIRVIENSEGQRTTPSVVAFTEAGKTLVGQAAKRQSVTNPSNTFYAIKRLIGRKFDDKVVQKDQALVPYKIVKAKNGDAWVDVQGEAYAPPRISADVLRKMKKTAEDFLGETVSEAVITVPAYFNDSQRQATKDAGEIAGLKVLRIINEPTAAALGYSLHKTAKQDQTIAVYDLGGGTFDISIIEVAEVDGEKQFEVHSTNGDTFLGGEDFDNVIIEHATAEFKKQHGADLVKDPIALQRLKEACEKMKIELSSSQQSELNLPYISANESGPLHLQFSLTRAKYESMVEKLVDRTIAPVKEAIKDAGLTVEKIDEVILVGGQTRMPLVQKKVEELFKKQPRKDVNPDEAVAIGAAVQGSVLSGDRSDVLLLDVTPLTLGIETLGGVMTPLIDKNTTIPASKSQVFSTAEDNQKAVTIHVLQGERKQVQYNKSLGNFNLDDIKAAPRGMPQIEVKFDIDQNGLLNVSAKDKETNKEQSIIIKASGGLSEDEIEKMKRDAEAHAADDKKFEELIAKRNEADALVHAVQKAKEEVGSELSEDESKQVDEKLEALKEALKEEDGEKLDNAVKELVTASENLTKLASEKAQKDSQNDKAGPNAETKDDSDVIDADFEEEEDRSK